MKENDIPTRNPSPPPLTEEEAEKVSGDFIKDTLFSKRWVLDLLLRLYKHEQKTIYKEKKEEEEEEAPNENEDSLEQTLDTEFESDLCQLWDMTANSEVALFLYEHDCKDVIEHALKETHSPRLMEICFGIVGNLFCVKEIRVSFTESEQFRKRMLGYLSVTDALSLVELTRFMCTILSCTSCSSLWLLDICDENACAVEQLVYLLGNSLNTDLLTHIIEMIDIVLDFDDDCVDRYVNVDLLVGIMDALGLLKDNGKFECLVTLAHIMQAISSSNKGSEVLATEIDKFLDFLTTCMNIFMAKDSIELSVSGHMVFYASMFSCLSSIVTDHRNALLSLLNNNVVFLRIFLDYLRKELVEIHDGDKSSSSCVYVIPCVESLFRIMEMSLASDCGELKEYVLSKDFKHAVGEVAKFIQNIKALEEIQETASSMTNLIK